MIYIYISICIQLWQATFSTMGNVKPPDCHPSSLSGDPCCSILTSSKDRFYLAVCKARMLLNGNGRTAYDYIHTYIHIYICKYIYTCILYTYTDRILIWDLFIYSIIFRDFWKRWVGWKKKRHFFWGVHDLKKLLKLQYTNCEILFLLGDDWSINTPALMFWCCMSNWLYIQHL